MTAAIQSLDETTPASRIMRERDEARRKHDDLTDHCVKQGAYIAKLDSEMSLLRRTLETTTLRLEMAQKLVNSNQARVDRITALKVADHAALLQFVRDVWEEIEASKVPDLDVIREALHTFVAEHGNECDVCCGDGQVSDERMHSDPSSSRGFSISRVVDECQHCRGGRVPR